MFQLKKMKLHIISIFLLCLLHHSANAQNLGKDALVLKPQADPNGVDMTFGTFTTASPFKVEVPASRHLSNQTIFNGRRVVETLHVWLKDRANGSSPGETGGRYVTVSIGPVSKIFFCYGTVPCEAYSEKDGSILWRNTSDIYTYIDRDGTKYEFFSPIYYSDPCSSNEYPCDVYRLEEAVSKITYPDGEKLTFSPSFSLEGSGSGAKISNIVTSNLGYSIKFLYPSVNGQIPSLPAGQNWLGALDLTPEVQIVRGGEVFSSTYSDRSPPVVIGGTPSAPNNGVQTSTLTLTDNARRVYRVDMRADATWMCDFHYLDITYFKPVKIVSPGGIATDIGYTEYTHSGNQWPVHTVTKDSKTWTYAWTPTGPDSAWSSVTQITDPAGGVRKRTISQWHYDDGVWGECQSIPNGGNIDNATDGELRTTAYVHNLYGLERITLPRGIYSSMNMIHVAT